MPELNSVLRSNCFFFKCYFWKLLLETEVAWRIFKKGNIFFNSFV